MAQKLILVRGLPGSGKSTFAKSLLARNPRMKHLEADMYFSRDGEYIFDPTKLRAAHQWCWEATCEAMLEGRDVVVTNTFTQLWELDRYLNFRYRFEVIVVEMRTMWGNIHGVPADKVEAMEHRWEDLPDEEVMFDFSDEEKFVQILK